MDTKIFSQYKEVYSRLQDEVSRQIFIGWFRYFLDEDERHLREIVDISSKFHKQTFGNKETLDEFLKRHNKQVIIYGAAQTGSFFFD
jgi:hypothetical protein